LHPDSTNLHIHCPWIVLIIKQKQARQKRKSKRCPMRFLKNILVSDSSLFLNFKNKIKIYSKTFVVAAAVIKRTTLRKSL
jgi:hypothetical protein